jgi:uncharacterized protein (DUF58 family)
MSSFAFHEQSLAAFAKTVQLAATRYLEGSHQRKNPSSGIEFHSARAYEAGDESRLIDWRRFATSDKLYVRRQEQQAQAGHFLSIDRSPRMAEGDKSLWAHTVAAAVGFVAQSLGDPWAVAGCENQPASEIYESLARQKAACDLTSAIENLRARDRWIIVSDFFFDPQILRSALEEAQADGSEVILLQALSSDELRFPFQGFIEFIDPESDDRLSLDARQIQKRYLAALAELQSEWRSCLDEKSRLITLEVSSENLLRALEEIFAI